MAKKINLKDRKSRAKLEPYREPHWVKFPIEAAKGCSLGFRRSPDTGEETWHARLYLDGQYLRTNLGTVSPEFDYREAYSAALGWARTLKDAGLAHAREYTLEQCRDEYLRHLQGNGDLRHMAKRRQADMRLTALLPTGLLRRKVNDLQTRDITDLQRDYSQRRNEHNSRLVSPDTVNRTMTCLIACLNYCYKHNMVKSRDAWKSYERLSGEIEGRRSKKYIPATERERFLAACPGHLRAICTALHLTAARPSELRRLKVSDVDLQKGEDGKEAVVRLVTFKGKEPRARKFDLPDGSAVRALFAAQVQGKQPNDHVFTNAHGKPWTQANLAKAHNAVRDTGGFSDAFETYVWRHCRVTDYAAKFPAPDVAELAGTSLHFLQKNYYKANAERRAEMARMS